MPKHTKKERKKDGRYVNIDYYIFRSEAWKELKPREIMVWLLLCKRFNGANNGRISLSIREIAHHGKMSQGSASLSINKLIELGFIKKTFNGSFSQKENRASEFRMTHVKCGDELPTKDFTRWKPEKKTVPKEMQKGIKLDAPSNNNVV